MKGEINMIRCEDAYCATFASYPVMQKYHQDQSKESTWQRCRVKNLRIEPLDANSAAQARPIPEEAPVITTVLFLKSFNWDGIKN